MEKGSLLGKGKRLSNYLLFIDDLKLKGRSEMEI